MKERIKKSTRKIFFTKEERMCVYGPVDSTKTLVVLSLQKLSGRLVSCRQCMHVRCARVMHTCDRVPEKKSERETLNRAT